MARNRTITFRGSRDELLRVIRQIPKAMAKPSGDMHPRLRNVIKAAKLATGREMWVQIHKAYKVKSKGGTDSLGIKWKDLSPATKAAREPTTALKRKMASNIRRGGSTSRPTLSPAQDRVWRGIFVSTLKRLVLNTPLREAKAIAARRAWAILKSRGARTKLSIMGNRKVPILVESGKLLGATKPGRLQWTVYNRPLGQILDIRGDTIRIGIDSEEIPYAAKQNKTRPIIPGVNKIRPWVRKAIAKGRDTLAEGLEAF